MADKRTALLVISFGTSYPETCEKTIGAIERDLAARFPEADLFRAFTSRMIIKKIRKRDGVQVDTPREALERIAAAGYGRVMVQTTHIINGTEYSEMVHELHRHCPDSLELTIGRPLLTTHSDFSAVTAILAGVAADRAPDEAWVFMGHGTVHHANSAYPAMAWYLGRHGGPGLFLATVEGYPELSEVLPLLAAGGYKKVSLMPFMIVAGDHAQNDMAGEDPDSWKNQLAAAGYEVTCHIKGLGEIPAIRQLFVAHAADSIDK